MALAGARRRDPHQLGAALQRRLQQAGAFGMRNVPAQDAQRLVGIFCPNYLLPYARQVVSDLLTTAPIGNMSMRPA